MPIELEDYRDIIALLDEWQPPQPFPRSDLASAAAAILRHLGHEAQAGVDPLRMLRGVLTTLPPGAIDDRIEADIDRLLQTWKQMQPIERAEDLPRLSRSSNPAGAKLSIWRGDITRLAADVIVNAANAQMLGCFMPFHACIDNAIHWAAGPALRRDCDRIMTAQGHAETTGTAKITRAYNLPSKYVLHTVGPIVQGRLQPLHERQLASAYRACLDLTSHFPDIGSLAFCGISTGVFGFPRIEASRIAIDTVTEWLQHRQSSLHVIFNVFAAEDEEIYRKALQ